MKKWNEFQEFVSELAKAYPRWRAGQVFFNALMEYDSEAAEMIRGDSTLDPFHRDEPVVVESHLGQFLLERWKEEE